jgi:hypothetical protein
MYVRLSICPSVRPSAWISWALSGQIFMNFDIWVSDAWTGHAARRGKKKSAYRVLVGKLETKRTYVISCVLNDFHRHGMPDFSPFRLDCIEFLPVFLFLMGRLPYSCAALTTLFFYVFPLKCLNLYCSKCKEWEGQSHAHEADKDDC